MLNNILQKWHWDGHLCCSRLLQSNLQAARLAILNETTWHTQVNISRCDCTALNTEQQGCWPWAEAHTLQLLGQTLWHTHHICPPSWQPLQRDVIIIKYLWIFWHRSKLLTLTHVWMLDLMHSKGLSQYVTHESSTGWQRFGVNINYAIPAQFLVNNTFDVITCSFINKMCVYFLTLVNRLILQPAYIGKSLRQHAMLNVHGILLLHLPRVILCKTLTSRALPLLASMYMTSPGRTFSFCKLS